MRQVALSIAGFDPSGGAGILSDIKTFESHKVYGLGVCTAVTVQNDIEFESVDWVNAERIIDQISILVKRFEIKHVKIGLIENLKVLEQVIDYLKTNLSNSYLVWDPIMAASAGFNFHKNWSADEVVEICKRIDLITPNNEELELWSNGMDNAELLTGITQNCDVLVTGGHSLNNSDDLLYSMGKCEIISGERLEMDKHGTGCVLSSAILANKALGKKLELACANAKEYVTKYLRSSTMMLGYHNG